MYGFGVQAFASREIDGLSCQILGLFCQENQIQRIHDESALTVDVQGCTVSEFRLSQVWKLTAYRVEELVCSVENQIRGDTSPEVCKEGLWRCYICEVCLRLTTLQGAY
jgi:hypothetical protein